MNGSSQSVLITGATGFLGGLFAVTLLEKTDLRLVAPIRPHHSRESLLEPIVAELIADGHSPTDDQLARVVALPLPPQERLPDLLPSLRELNVKEIVHTSACLSYIDTPLLEEVNIGLTRELLDLGRRLDIQRFIHISTAFACGFGGTLVREELHPEPPFDPNDYIRTKRAAEHLVAKSGLPFLILRPSAVIGHSVDGRYGGKVLGLYQVWDAVTRLFGRRFYEELHLPAPTARCQFVHQDAVAQAFLAAYRFLPPGSIANFVSGQSRLPTIRQLVQQILEQVGRPRRIYFYEASEDLPLEGMTPESRSCLEVIASHIDMMSYDYTFETRHLDRLKAMGMEMTDVTLDSALRCQRRYLQDSPAAQQSMAFLAQMTRETGERGIEVIDVARRRH
jgi:nucleoside-diphosphate-sugar epimerase